jgi:hypothetical protein
MRSASLSLEESKFPKEDQVHPVRAWAAVCSGCDAIAELRTTTMTNNRKPGNSQADLDRDDINADGIEDYVPHADDRVVTREEAGEALRREHRPRLERLLAQASTETQEELPWDATDAMKLLTQEAEQQYREVAHTICDLIHTMEAAKNLAAQIEIHAGEVDPMVEQGMRQGLDTLLMAVAALEPPDQRTLIAKIELLGRLGPTFDKNVNLRAMIMAALEHDAIRLSRANPGFEIIRIGPVQ